MLAVLSYRRKLVYILVSGQKLLIGLLHLWCGDPWWKIIIKGEVLKELSSFRSCRFRWHGTDQGPVIGLEALSLMSITDQGRELRSTLSWFHPVLSIFISNIAWNSFRVYLIDTGEHIRDAEPISLKLLPPEFLDTPILCFKLKNKLEDQVAYL